MSRPVCVTVEAIANASLEATFDAIVPIELSKMFVGYGPLPAVTGTRDQTGAWDHVGATRTVELADRSSADEEITAHERPRYFAYCLTGLSGALGALVEEVRGEFWFSAADHDSTKIRWRYTFEPRGLRRPIVALVVARLWKGYARKAIAVGVREAEPTVG